jgi:DNA-directed RNA polymerase specialized sigma24 family protein
VATAGRGERAVAVNERDVDHPALLKKNWVLTQDAFDALLLRLDADPTRAAERYEHLRQALVTFFEYRGCRFPEDHADETINRVARRIVDGTEIYPSHLTSYFYGVARNLLKEQWDAQRTATASLEAARMLYAVSQESREIEADAIALRDRRLDCLERCLEDLSTRDHDLIGSYYTGETSARVQNRKQLAAQLGIPLNALRIRALRIREKLGACVSRCEARRTRT